MPAYSVVVLCYRAGESCRPFIQEVIDRLQGSLQDWELLLVANYLPDVPDDTPTVVRDIAKRDGRIRVVAKPKEGMMGWDVRSGLEAATGDVIAFIDGDGQMRAEDLMRAYEVLVREHCDLVTTYRVARGDSIYRAGISLAYNAIFRTLFPGSGLRDVNSKPKVFTRAAYERMTLVADDWFIDAEIIIQARRLKFRMQEIPTEFKALENRASFVRPSALWEFTQNLARARAREFMK